MYNYYLKKSDIESNSFKIFLIWLLDNFQNYRVSTDCHKYAIIVTHYIQKRRSLDSIFFCIYEIRIVSCILYKRKETVIAYGRRNSIKCKWRSSIVHWEEAVTCILNQYCSLKRTCIMHKLRSSILLLLLWHFFFLFFFLNA